MKKLILLGFAAAILNGCALGGTRNGAGMLFTDTKDSITVTANTGTSKMGSTCAFNILGLVSTGDMSVETAKKISGISKVATVDYSQFSILTFFAKTCVIVKGE
jgi:hypothetical protein